MRRSAGRGLGAGFMQSANKLEVGVAKELLSVEDIVDRM
jgi:hypothetical protein